MKHIPLLIGLSMITNPLYAQEKYALVERKTLLTKKPDKGHACEHGCALL